MTNEEAKAFLDNLKICIKEHPIVADWLVEIANRKTEPTISKMEQVESPIYGVFKRGELSDEDVKDLKRQVGLIIEYANKKKDEPQLTPNYCGTCKHREVPCGDLPCDVCHGYSHYEPKDEPQICDTCRYYNSNIPCGSTPSACKKADKFAEEFVEGLKKLQPKVELQTYITEDRDTQILDAWQVHHRSTTSVEDEPQSLEQFRVGLEYHTDTTHFGKVKGESITTNKAEDEPQYKDCFNCRYEEGDERCGPCSEGYNWYWEPKVEPQRGLIACPIQEETAEYYKWLYGDEPQTDFLTFLYNVINPNEMEEYRAMYEAKGRATKDEPQTERSNEK